MTPAMNSHNGEHLKLWTPANYRIEVEGEGDENWNVNMMALQDIADGNHGSLITLSGGYTFPVSPEFRLPISLSTTYADEDYMSSYFGIDGDDAAWSGLDTENADARIQGCFIESHSNVQARG